MHGTYNVRAMTSKQRKRELKQQYRESQRTAVSRALVAAESVSLQMLQKHLQDRFRSLRIALETHFPEQEDGPVLVRQGLNPQNQIQVSLVQVSEMDLDSARSFEILMQSPLESLLGSPAFAVTGQRSVSSVIDLIFAATIRALGPITKGVLLDYDGEIVADEWLAWSWDYVGPTMAEVPRRSGAETPDYSGILAAHPDLVFSPRWWQFWL